MKIVNRIFLISALSLWMSVSWAVPANRDILKVEIQPDGETLCLRINGDEFFNYWTTEDGIPVLKGADGFWVYACDLIGNGLMGSDVVAKNPEKREWQEQILAKGYGAKVMRKLVSRNYVKGKPVSGFSFADIPALGEKRGLVIMVQFQDREFIPECTQEQIYRQLNESGYSDFGMTGSVRDYFMDQSQGKFFPHFDVVGPVTLSRDMSYYGNDSIESTPLGSMIVKLDLNLGSMAEEACLLARSSGVDFSSYDQDGDGVVDFVYFLYAGYAQSNGAASQTIWPQMSYLSDSLGIDLEIDGVTINRFACSSELSGFAGSEISGIGTFCHEFSHTLGLFDIYGNTPLLSMGNWNLMDLGCYNHAGKTPSGFSSFEKMCLGWMQPVCLQEPSSGIVVPPLETGNIAFMVISESDSSEYYLVENRQRSGKWDAGIGGDGLLFVHVHYDEEVWMENSVNDDPEHLRMHIVPANGDFNASSDPLSVPFPGSLEKTAFTSMTTPGFYWLDGNQVKGGFTNIRTSGDTVLFDFMQTLPAPVALEATNVRKNSFTANWEAVEGADHYTVFMKEMDGGQERNIPYIEDTKYTFGGLEPGHEYIYRVQAFNDILSSSYSNEIKVGTPASVGQESEDSGWLVYAENGVLHVESYSDIWVYDLSGRIRAMGKDRLSIALPQGIYLVKSMGKTVKVSMM